MKVIFTAGPFRATQNGGPWEQETHVRRMEELALWINRQGAAALCPHTMTRFYQDALPDQFWIDMTRELMRRADAVAVGPHYKTSTGTLAEIAEAKERGMPIFYFYTPAWDASCNDAVKLVQYINT